jgi:tetratricopeptide (TPR) repeat protein
LQEEELLDLLDEALQAGVLIEEGGGTTIMYQFWHPLLVSHLYEHLSAARRAGYHRQAARALKQLARGDEAAAMVRHLLAGGAEADELTSYTGRAGDQAYVLAAYPEATYYYTLTLEHLEPQTSHARLLPLAEHLGECHMIRGNYPEARAAYTRALQVLQDRQPTIDASAVQRQALLWCEIGWRRWLLPRRPADCLSSILPHRRQYTLHLSGQRHV